jgi:diaminohydroxyphosphoribosylaminopyrimidine deaminase / 5-amino-6-(5-phosphoribosylamino)uracil reductase
MNSEFFMQRCIQLARQASGWVAPNPMVGAVLVHGEKIIGEGWHHRYGESHAEVNCIASVKEEDKHLISSATLYVSLEPCAHFGKTPPCADLIIRHKIPVVIIGCRDPFTKVDGKGIEKLEAAGVSIIVGVLENECKELNKRFLTYHTLQRPYIILKWAQTSDGKVSGGNGPRLLISNEYSIRLVHRWRSEEAAILVGTNTALSDDPELTNRFWDGPSPVRLVLDKDLRLPPSLKIFNRGVRTIIFNTVKHDEESNLLYYRLTREASIVHQIIQALYQLQIQSLLVEGGPQLLQSFIAEGLWDEARVIQNSKLKIQNGLPAPQLSRANKIAEQTILTDTIETFQPFGIS